MVKQFLFVSTSNLVSFNYLKENRSTWNLIRVFLAQKTLLQRKHYVERRLEQHGLCFMYFSINGWEKEEDDEGTKVFQTSSQTLYTFTD